MSVGCALRGSTCQNEHQPSTKRLRLSKMSFEAELRLLLVERWLSTERLCLSKRASAEHQEAPPIKKCASKIPVASSIGRAPILLPLMGREPGLHPQLLCERWSGTKPASPIHLQALAKHRKAPPVVLIVGQTPIPPELDPRVGHAPLDPPIFY